MYYIYIALDCLNWERPPFRLARKLAWFWSRLARYLIFLAKYPFFLLRISWLIGANGSGFIFLEPSIRLADSQFANRVLGQSSNLSGYKKSPKSLIYKGFGRCALASLARFERAAFRLGGERSILLSYRDSFQSYSIFPKLLASTDLKSVQLGNNFSVQWNFKNSGFSPVMRLSQSFLCLGSTLPTLCSYCAICVLANCIIIADFYKKSK